MLEKAGLSRVCEKGFHYYLLVRPFIAYWLFDFTASELKRSFSKNKWWNTLT